jgi:hypothetical protein
MQPLARIAAGITIAALFAFAPSGAALAQPMTADEFFEAGLRLADDKDLLRILVLGDEQLGAEKEAILIEDARMNLRNRAYSDLVLATMEVKPETGDRPEYYFLATLLAGGEIVVDGILRLPYERQHQLLDFTRLLTELLITKDPELCAIAGADPRAPELIHAEIFAYETMSADAVRDLVALSREAIAAVIEARPAPVYTEAEMADAAATLQTAIAADEANLPLLTRIGMATTVDDIDPADLCRIGVAHHRRDRPRAAAGAERAHLCGDPGRDLGDGPARISPRLVASSAVWRSRRARRPLQSGRRL